MTTAPWRTSSSSTSRRIAQDYFAHIRVILVFHVTCCHSCYGSSGIRFAGGTPCLITFSVLPSITRHMLTATSGKPVQAGWGGMLKQGNAWRHPDLGIDLAQLTQTPRKYGLHGTLTPPMRLCCEPATFVDALEVLAQSLAPVGLGDLRVKPIDGFLAIVPDVQPQALSDTAAQIVRALDPFFRAPLSEHDLARRRASGLTKRQDALMQLWGYPYVMEEFRFHVTLTGRLDTATIPQVRQAAMAWFGPALEERHHLDALVSVW